MIIIDLVSTIIESFALSYTALKYFSVSEKKWWIILTLITMIEIQYFNFINIDNNLLICIISLVHGIFISWIKKSFSLIYFIYPLFIFIGIIVCNMSSLLISSAIFNVAITDLSLKFGYFLFAIILSRIFICIFCYGCIQLIKKTQLIILEVKKHWIYLPFMIVVAIMYTTLMESIVYRTVSIRIIYYLMVELVIMCLFAVGLIVVINKQTKENIAYSKKIMDEEYQKKLSVLVRKSMEQVTKDKHMMTYTLMTLKNQLQNNDKTQMEYLINQELNRYGNYNFISSTNNYYFDYEITNKVNSLAKSGVNIKALFTIDERNTLLNKQEVVEYMICCLDKVIDVFPTSKEIQLFLYEKGQYLVFKIELPSSLGDCQVIFEPMIFLKTIDINTDEKSYCYSFLFVESID